MSGLWLVTYVLLWVTVVILAFAVVVLLRQVGVLHLRVKPMGVHFGGEGPPLDAAAPDLVDWQANRATVVTFTAPDCEICASLRPGLAAIDRDYPEVAVVAVDHSTATAATFEAFNVRSTPYVVAVDGGGVVRARGIANSADQVEEMLAEVLGGTPA